MNILYLVLYFLIIYIFTLFIKNQTGKEGFLLGDRNIGTLPMALSIASTWIWAPALFVSAQQAYENGYVGLLYFLVPNVLTLIIFIPFAKRLRKSFPAGYSLMGYMGKTYSNRVRGVYLFQMTALSLLSTVVQIVAGGTVISVLTGIPFMYTSIILGLFVYMYCRKSGIKASIYTGVIQMIIIILSLIVIVGWTTERIGVDQFITGLNGINEVTFTNAEGIQLLMLFGIPTAISLLAGPFGDQNFWQRALSVKKGKLTQSFIYGAIAFAIVPLLMAVLGFLAVGDGFTPSDNSMVNIEIATAQLPAWTVVFFIFILLSGLMSTVDSNLSAISTLLNDIRPTSTLRDFRIAMLIFVVLAITISNIPASIIDLFLFYGILRATTFSTTILTLMKVELAERGVFYGILTSLIIGFPIFIYGQFTNDPLLSVVGSLSALLLSGIVAIGITKTNRWRNII